MDLSEWENVTLEGTQWTILIKRLEDLMALQNLLLVKPVTTSSNLLLRHQEAIKVSVKSVLEGGNG